MRFTIGFVDSELRDVARDDDRDLVRLCLAAASASAIGDARGRGWLSGVTLEITGGVRLQGDTAHAFGRIAEAGLRHGERPSRRLVVPGTLTAAREGEVVELALRLANGTQFVVAGHHLEAVLADDARLTPDLSC